MPTENRSSNTELAVQHPQGRRERFQKWVLATKHPVLGYLDGTWLARGDDREGYADKYVQGLWVAYKEFGQPAPQPHPDPIAWMVGTALWWNKEEAERDAAATGKAITPFGPMTGTYTPVEQHQGEPVAWMYTRPEVEWPAFYDKRKDAAGWEETPLYTHADPGEVERIENERAEQWRLRRDAEADRDTKAAVIAELRAQLAERDVLLREAACHATRMEPMSASCLNRIDAVLDASAEPNALPDPLGCNDCAHADCGKFDGPRQVECRAMADNACARPGASS